MQVCPIHIKSGGVVLRAIHRLGLFICEGSVPRILAYKHKTLQLTKLLIFSTHQPLDTRAAVFYSGLDDFLRPIEAMWLAGLRMGISPIHSPDTIGAQLCHVWDGKISPILSLTEAAFAHCFGTAENLPFSTVRKPQHHQGCKWRIFLPHSLDTSLESDSGGISHSQLHGSRGFSGAENGNFPPTLPSRHDRAVLQ